MRIKPLTLLFTFLVFTLALQGVAVGAGTPVVQFTAQPTWLKPLKPYDKSIPARDVENGYFYQLREEQLHVEKQANYRHIITQIVSQAGIQNGSQISIGFDPSYEQLSIHKITVWRNGVAQQRLKPGMFNVLPDEQELSRFIYQGSYSAYCILDDIRKGDRIEYSYTLTGRNPIFGGHFFKDIYLQGGLPAAHMYRNIIAAATRLLTFKYFNKSVQAKVSSEGGFTCYEWEAFQVKPAQEYEGQPDWYNEYAYVQVTDYRNWQEVADWALKINAPVSGLHGELAREAEKLKKAAGADKAKYFRDAVTMVQDEVRYMGIEIGEYSHRANTPERVYAQRYGDCKDKAQLLVALLNANGIEAHMVLVNANLKAHVTDFLPSPNVFNHAVVTAIVNGKVVNVDATVSYQRGKGSAIYFPDYGKGLVVKPGTNSLTALLPGKAGKISYHETFNIPGEKGKTKFKVSTTYTLNEADYIRERLANKGMAETEKDYVSYYTKIFPKIEQADSVTVIDDPDKNVVTTIEHYRINNLFKKDSISGQYKVSFYAYYINNQFLNIANNAHVPLAVNYPCNIEHTLKVTLPGGWSIENDFEEIKQDAFRFTTRTQTTGDTLVVHYTYNSLKDVVPANKLNDYRTVVKHISNDLLSYNITYTPGTVNRPFVPNYGMIVFAAFLTLVMVALSIKIYCTETDGVIFAPGAGFMQLGGWLILVALGLFVTPFKILAEIIDVNYFSMSTWNMHLPGRSQLALRTIFVFELTCNMFIMGYAIFCLVLLIARRDILLKYITGLYAFNLIYVIADFALVYQLNNGRVSEKIGYAIFQAIVVAAIWIPYFKKSVRVEQTFVVPYPKTNYSYEELEPTRNYNK